MEEAESRAGGVSLVLSSEDLQQLFLIEFLVQLRASFKRKTIYTKTHESA